MAWECEGGRRRKVRRLYGHIPIWMQQQAVVRHSDKTIPCAYVSSDGRTCRLSTVRSSVTPTTQNYGVRVACCADTMCTGTV